MLCYLTWIAETSDCARAVIFFQIRPWFRVWFEDVSPAKSSYGQILRTAVSYRPVKLPINRLNILVLNIYYVCYEDCTVNIEN